MSSSTDTTNQTPLFQPPAETWNPSGDLRRDLFDLRSHYYSPNQQFPATNSGTPTDAENTQLLDTVRYTLEKNATSTENNEENEISSPKNSESVEDLSNLPDEELELVKTNLLIQNMELSPQDEIALANAIRVCAFHIDSVQLQAVKLPSLVLLARALREKPSLQVFNFDMSFERTLRNFDSEQDLQSQFSNSELLKDHMAERTASQQQAAGGKKGKTADTTNNGPSPYSIPEDILLQSPALSPLMTCAKHISLRGCSLNDDDAYNLSRILRNHSHLLTLSLWGNQITDRGAGHIARALRTNQSLVGIELGMNRITDEGAEKILQVFQAGEITGLETLQEMRLDVYQSIHKVDSIQKAEQLPMPSELLPVVLGKKAKPPKTSFQTVEWDEAIQVISAPEEEDNKKKGKGKSTEEEEEPPKPYIFQLPGNKNLRYVGLAGNLGITDESGRLMAPLLENVKQLEKIALNHTSVSEECLLKMVEVLNARTKSSEEGDTSEEEETAES